MISKFIIKYIGTVLILLGNYLCSCPQNVSYQHVMDSLQKLEKIEEYNAALQYLKMNQDSFPDRYFQLSKEEIYLNEKLGKYDDNLIVFHEGHKKGYFYLIHKALPNYKPYLDIEGFDTIAAADQKLRSYAIGNARTIYHLDIPNKGTDDKLPIIFIFHGGGSDMNRVKKHWHSGLLDSNYMKIYLQSYRHYDYNTFGWRSGDKRATDDILAIFNEICNNYHVDTSNVLLAGISAGASYAIGFALDQIIPIKGIIAFCPGMPGNLNTESDLVLPHTLKVFMVSGENDFYLQRQNQMKEIFDDNNIDYRHTIVQDMGHQYPVDEAKYIEMSIKYINQDEAQQ